MKKITLFIALVAMSVMSYALNPFAYGLSSQLSEDGAVLTVNYSLNADANSVNVLVLNGEEVVATVPADGITKGTYAVEVATANLPTGVQLTWTVEVNGTSVEAPTQHETTYSFYHPSSVDIDNNPENATFGLVLTNEAMQSVAAKTEGYLSAGFGAGIYAFNPAFEPIANGDKPGFNAGKTFSTVKNDYAPRRIRFSEDGRIFATAQDGSGEYLWEINPDNLDEWTTVFQGTNDGYTLKDAEGNFIAGTNSGFDVRGEGENLQLLMLSSSLPGAQVGSFACHVYDLGTATTWATAPTKEIPGANYMLVTNQSNAQFDKDGGVWYIQYRGTTTEAEPGLVHINKEGVEDYKWLRHYTRNAGFRFTDDFSKVVIAGVTSGANEKKATVYAVSQDTTGAPVLTEETVFETSVLGSNLNDFAWDYAGNLYCVSNSNELIVAWAMPYSGVVATPAAAQYAFQLAGSSAPTPSAEMELTVENLELDMETDDIIFKGTDAMTGIEMALIPDVNASADGQIFPLAANSTMTFGGAPLTIVEGTMFEIDMMAPSAKAVVLAYVGENLFKFNITMTAAVVEALELDFVDATVVVDDATGSLIFTTTYTDEEGVVYPVKVSLAGYEDAEFKEYEGPQISELQIGGNGDDDPWLDWAVADLASVVKEGDVITLEAEYTSFSTGAAYWVTISGTLASDVQPVEMVGVVKRALQYYDATIVLTHEADGTAHLYKVIEGVATEMSQNGIIARDPENAGDLLALSDIALTEDGKLVGVNSMVCQAEESYVDEGYKRGETRFYIWNDLDADPTVWFKSNMYGNWFRSKEGESMAVKGTSTNAQIMVTSIHASKYWSRFSVYSVIDGVYNEPAAAADGNEHYTWCEGPANGDLDENIVGAPYELLPSSEGKWILDGKLIDPIEFTQPAAIKEVIAEYAPIAVSNGKVFTGSSIVTVGEQVLMVAPFATEFGLLAGVKVLDITNGLAAATEVTTAYLDSDIEATAAATAVQVVEGGLVVTLVADATIYTLTTVSDTPDYMVVEEEITNLMIDLDMMALIGGPSSTYQVEVFLGLAEDENMDGQWSLSAESSVAIMGQDAIFIDGYAYDIDINTTVAKAVLHVNLNGEFYELRLNMTSTPAEVVEIVIENATIAIDTIPMFGDVVEYAMHMTANWTNPADGITYPVLVDVPVYYPDATEPSEILSTVTVGGMGDTDPWLGFGEGTLTITTVDGLVTATGTINNPYTGFAANITISGKLQQGPTTGLDNAQVEVNTVKVIKNGQLIINRNGVEYNVQGALIK